MKTRSYGARARRWWWVLTGAVATVTALLFVGPAEALWSHTALSEYDDPALLPGAPGDVVATARVKGALVQWSPPADTGGGPITSYTVTASPGDIAQDVEGTEAAFSGLSTSSTYTFTVRASNAYGTGPASAASNSVTPRRSSGGGGGSSGRRSSGTTTTTTTTPATSDSRSDIQDTDRVATAIQASRNVFATAGSLRPAALDAALTAQAVVLSRGDDYADALAGTPLAARSVAPLLLTPGNELDARVMAEIQRVLGSSGRVLVLGGEAAISRPVEAAIAGMGFTVTRIAGSTRFDTAINVARTIGEPSALVEVTGLGFADALSGGTAAAHLGGAVVLTNGAVQAPATAAYLAERPGVPRYAIGGPAAAADPGATPIVGPDRYATAAAVARTFFSAPSVVGLASGTSFADALAGGAHVAHHGGPLLLTRPEELPGDALAYLSERRASIGQGYVYGGQAAVSTAVRDAFRASYS